MICRDLNFLHPIVRLRLGKALEVLNAQIPGLQAFETWRSPKRQLELWHQGRSKPGNKVTNAKPWESWHQYGLAADVAVKVAADPKLNLPDSWSWDFDKDLVRETMKLHGLTGPAFEACHFQYVGVLTLEMAKAIAMDEGIFAVWEKVL